MKKYLSIFLFLSLLLTLVACTADFDANGVELNFGQSHVKQTVLKVWYDDNDGLFMEEVIKLFQQENPGIIVEFTQKGSVQAREDLKTYGRTDHGADVFQFRMTIWRRRFWTTSSIRSPMSFWKDYRTESFRRPQHRHTLL